MARKLVEAGGDVIGEGDDHALGVIGWATCWNDCDDDAHRAVVAFLVSRGARHHIFSAVAMNLADEVRASLRKILLRSINVRAGTRITRLRSSSPYG